MTAKSKFVLNAFIYSFVFAAILFLSAGRIDYLHGWIYVFTNLLTTAMNVFAAQKNLDLMSERSKPGEGTKPWDKLLLALSALVFTCTIVLAGLDSGRYHWSVHMEWSMNALGVILLISGQIVFLIARNENKFFSTVVRIQKNRGHSVCDTGIYRAVRHPGYLGMIISTMGLPLLLGSQWAVLPTVLAIILLCIRTQLEDQTLKVELNYYLAYTKKTRYKLIPWVW